jgi:DNA primase
MNAGVPHVDLLAIVTRDTVLAGRGKERHGPCPFCGGTDRFWVNTESNWWFCRRCAIRGGDAITYIRQRDGVGYRDAMAALDGVPPPPPPALPRPPVSAGAEWQGHAARAIARWEAALWADEGRRALAWLGARGLSHTTIRAAHLGYCAADGKVGAWYEHRGITIPLHGVDGRLYGIRVRRAFPRDSRVKNKYLSIRGTVGPLYGRVGTQPVLLVVEGYFDCLLALQHAGKVVDVVTMNLCRPAGQWVAPLLGYRRILVCLDADTAGESGWAHWSWIGTARPLHLPAGKDVTAAIVDHGLDLAAWLAEQVGEQGQEEVVPEAAGVRDGWLEDGDERAF